jgi:alpha-1,2-mannosyltransferase
VAGPVSVQVGGAGRADSRVVTSAERLEPMAVVRGFAVCLLPVLVGLYVGATTFAGGTAWPWQPQMADLDVYRRAGAAVLGGTDFYALPGLPFLYPPFAALVAVPLALLPPIVVQIGWTTAGVLSIVAVLHRLGLSGWRLSLIAAAACYFLPPVRETLAYGQVGIVLVALVVLDLVPGPRTLPGRLLPEGTLTGLAAAVKLTPAIFVVYLLGVGRRRTAGTAVIVTLAATVVAWATVPGPSLEFWGRLVHGDTGLGHSILYVTNESVLADVLRALGLGPLPALIGLVLSALVALLGVWAAIGWHRLGEVSLAVSLCGVAGLLASPVSWLHHFVWIVPFAICLARRGAPHRRSPLPSLLLIPGWLFVAWVVAAPFYRLPAGGDAELRWLWWQQLIGSMTAMLGVAVLIAAVVTSRRLIARG